MRLHIICIVVNKCPVILNSACDKYSVVYVCVCVCVAFIWKMALVIFPCLQIGFVVPIRKLFVPFERIFTVYVLDIRVNIGNIFDKIFSTHMR